MDKVFTSIQAYLLLLNAIPSLQYARKTCFFRLLYEGFYEEDEVQEKTQEIGRQAWLNDLALYIVICSYSPRRIVYTTSNEPVPVARNIGNKNRF